MPIDYLTYVLAAREYISKHPGVDRTKLHRWTKQFLRCKSDKAVRFMNKMVKDDYIREIEDVTRSKMPKRRGKRKTRYVVVKA